MNQMLQQWKSDAIATYTTRQEYKAALVRARACGLLAQAWKLLAEVAPTEQEHDNLLQERDLAQQWADKYMRDGTSAVAAHLARRP